MDIGCVMAVCQNTISDSFYVAVENPIPNLDQVGAELATRVEQYSSVPKVCSGKEYERGITGIFEGSESKICELAHGVTDVVLDPIFVKQTRKFVQRVVGDLESLDRFVYLIRSEEVNPAFLQKVGISEM
jgi:hypothetical protein